MQRLAAWRCLSSGGNEHKAANGKQEKPAVVKWCRSPHRARRVKIYGGYRYSGSNMLAAVLTNYWGGNDFDMLYIVGQLMPNELGIHDMSGQASEWIVGPWTEFGELEPAHNPGRITMLDFAEPFYVIQKGGNHLMEIRGRGGDADFTTGDSFRPEGRVRIQPNPNQVTGLDRELLFASIRFVRNAGL